MNARLALQLMRWCLRLPCSAKAVRALCGWVDAFADTTYNASTVGSLVD